MMFLINFDGLVSWRKSKRNFLNESVTQILSSFESLSVSSIVSVCGGSMIVHQERQLSARWCHFLYSHHTKENLDYWSI